MRIVRLSVENFRGIRSLQWDPPPGVTCLVGRGDSAKTTILDAIELVLLPRAWAQFLDADFHDGDTEKPIVIEVTVVEAPSQLLTQEKFGLEQRGWSQEDELRDEPQDDDTPALTIRLQVDDSLDPAWRVISDRNPEGRAIGFRDRAVIGAVRLGDDGRRQLSWVRGSSLARVTGSPDAVGAALGEVHRSAAQAINELDFEELAEAAVAAGTWGAEYGSYAELPLQVGLDPRNLNIGAGALALRQGNGISASALGMGSRRLLGLAIQRQVVGEPVVTLVDEVEHGLEPHRLRHALRQLRASDHQVLLVSHSPVAVAELGAKGLGLVRRDNEGNVTVRHADEHLQGVIRALPEAVLGHRIVVCEGETEYGLARGLVAYWDGLVESPLAATGTVFVPGGGSQAPERAAAFRDLGYECIYWGDADVPISPSPDELQSKGIETVIWENGKNTEQRIMADVGESLLETLWDIAADEKGNESVTSQLAEATDRSGRPPADWDAWTKEYPIDELRDALGRAATKGSWYKQIGVGERVGAAIAEDVSTSVTTDLGQKLAKLRDLAYGN